MQVCSKVKFIVKKFMFQSYARKCMSGGEKVVLIFNNIAGILKELKIYRNLWEQTLLGNVWRHKSNYFLTLLAKVFSLWNAELF